MIRKIFISIYLFTATICYADMPTLSIYTDIVVKETFIDSKNAKLFCRTMGKGKPLIILHGGPGLTQDYLLPQMVKLAESNFIIFYDQRGCGKSIGEINADTINIETFVSEIEAIRQAFHFDKISVLGHSWGGFLAMHYAISHPEHVDRLILANSMPASSEGLALFVSEWMKRTAPYQEELAAIHETKGFQEGDTDTIERLHRIIFRTYCYVPEKAHELSLRMTPLASVNGAKVYEMIRQNVFEKSFDLLPNLKNLNIWTLVIHGDFDPIPPVTAQSIHENIKNSKYIIMKDCGHFPYVEKPDEFFNEIREFLK